MFCGVQNFTWLSTTMGVIRSWLPSRSGRYNGLDAVKGHTLHSKMTLTPYFLHVPIRIFKQKFARKLSKTEIPPRQTVRWSGRQSAAVVRTSSECVRGVDLAVRRRIKWLIGGARRGEGVKGSALHSLLVSLFSPSLSLPPSARRKGHWGWTNKSHGHQTLLTTAALGLHSDSVLLVSAVCSYPHPKAHTHDLNTHMRARKHTHCWVSPSTWQWFYKSPQCEVSYSPSSTRTTSAVRAEGEGKRGTIQLLNCQCAALQGGLSIKLIKTVVKVVTVL